MVMGKIEWHRGCLRNEESTLADAEAELTRHQKRVQRLRESVDKSRRQLKRALRLGKDRYDDERFAPDPPES